MKKYSVGYDIGKTSVGWSIIDIEKNMLVDQGVRLFTDATQASERRITRSSRRTLRRKTWRKNQFKNALVDFSIVTREEIQVPGYFNFNATHQALGDGKLDESLVELNRESVYHLRAKALSEQVSTREMAIAIYNIVKTRGNFLMEHIDFSNETISEEELITNIMDLISQYANIIDVNDFTQKVIIPLINGDISNAELKKNIKKQANVEKDDMAEKKLEAICLFLGNWKANLTILDEKFPSKTVSQVKTDLDNQEEFIIELVNLFDLIETKKVLNEFDYICEYNVSRIEDYKAVYKYSENSENYEIYAKKVDEIVNVSNSKTQRKRTVKNTQNNFPNGLYLKEAKDILKFQSQFNDKITDEFIDVVCEIISARIPYYVGTLSKHENNNSWLTRTTDKFKYSYNYSKRFNIVDEEKTISDWKQTMISRCTYLPEEYALPKQSMLGELFSLLNDINIIISTNDLIVTQDQKYKIINNLVLNRDFKDILRHEDVKFLLGVEYFGFKNRDTSKMKFKKQVSLYFSIVDICPQLEITDFKQELLSYESSNLKQIESIILNLNIYDDQKNKYNVFVKEGYTHIESEKLSKLDTKEFLSLSRKFILETPMNQVGESLLEILLGTSNEQMTIISNACDSKGEAVNFSANKYYKYFQEGNELGIDVLIKNGIPAFPISRTVVRSLNQALLVHKEIIKEFGHPKKVVIETARDLGDLKKGVESAKHYDQITKMIDDLEKQSKEMGIDECIDFSNEGKSKIKELYSKYKTQIEMYLRQGGKDIITGNKIDINNLQNYDLDHILPRGFGDNSKNNLILIERSTNNQKQDRVPLEYIRDNQDIISEKAYLNRVEKLFENKMISEEKYKLLLLEDQDMTIKFIQKNLVDTRYIVREFGSILEAYTRYEMEVNNSISTKYAYVQGTYNTAFRQAFNFIKSRDLNSLHHAHDASIVVIIDHCLNSLFPGYATGNKFSAERYKRFVAEYLGEKENVESSYQNYLRTINVFRKMYLYAFGENFDDNLSLVNQVKDNYPRLSYKVERKATGQLFDLNPVSPNKLKTAKIADLKAIAKKYGIAIEKQSNDEKKDIDIKSLLISELGKKQLELEISEINLNIFDIIGVNNDKKAMQTVNCAATDFYKFKKKDKKGNYKVKHYAIHIPFAILDKEGNIDREKYCRLIKVHYKADELFDENGNLKEYLFRFRAFRNDMIYDTYTNQIKLHNMGSIVDKRLAYKPIFFSNYSSDAIIYRALQKTFRDLLSEKRELSTDKISEVMSVVSYKLSNFSYDDFEKVALEILNSNSTNNEKLFKIIYSLNYSRIIGVPTSLQNWRSVANASFFPKSDTDIQYVKIQTSPLGICVSKDSNGKLLIQGKHKKIKNNKEFSWNILN